MFSPILLYRCSDRGAQTSPADVIQIITKPLVKRWQAWRYLFWGPEMIQNAFDDAKGKPFELLAPDNRYVFVSDPQQIKELDNAPDTVLSLQAASKQVSRYHTLEPRFAKILIRKIDATAYLHHVRDFTSFIICTAASRCHI